MKKGRSFLEKMGLVERVGDEQERELEEQPCEDEEPDYGEMVCEYAEQVNCSPAIGIDTFVKDAYYENNLEDLSKSIFKVEEVSATLPSTMPVDVKRQTVQNILSSFGINVSDLDEDAKKRYATIKTVCNKMCNDEADEIKSLEIEVEELMKQAEEKRKKIQGHNEALEAIIKTSKEELEHITALWDFITAIDHKEV